MRTAAVTTTALLLWIVTIAQTVQAGPPLSAYTIFATGSVKIGGGSDVTGLVGSAFTHTQHSQKAITVAGGASIQGDARSAWDVQLNNGASITGDVLHPAGTTVNYPASASIGSDTVGDPELPALPAATVFSAGGVDHTGLGNGGSLTLAPGSYGEIGCGGGCDFYFSAGDYYFEKWTANNGTDLWLDLSGGHINIYVEGQIKFGSLDVHFTTPGTVSMESHHVATGSKPFGFSGAGGTDVVGDIFTPYSGINLGGGACCSTFTGTLIAGGRVSINHGVDGTVSVEEASWSNVKTLYANE